MNYARKIGARYTLIELGIQLGAAFHTLPSSKVDALLAFMLSAARLIANDDDVRKPTRLAATHHRLAEAECNGDWPCDNGQRAVGPCARCEARYVPERLGRDGLCQQCRTEDSIRALCAEHGVSVEFQGDPRGWTVKLSKTEQEATS